MFFRKKKKSALEAQIEAVKKTREEQKIDRKRQPFIVKLFYLVMYSGLALFLIVCFGLWLYSRELSDRYHLDDGALGGSLWELPSRVYARPVELYTGKPLKIKDLVTELGYLEYQKDNSLPESGTYYIDGDVIYIYKRGFGFWDTKEPEQILRITLKEGKISGMIDVQTQEQVVITRLDPLLIGSIYPKHGQDRHLISLKETPSILVDTILATEDRRFFSHPGVDPKGLIRAGVQAIKTGSVRQGASTITQQFVKNHYLTNERTVSRKLKEALMSLVLEKHYTKEQILEGYLNEIFLGQDGKRSIHGFGLASEFYFGKTLEELGVHQIASLVSLVREPSRANPFKHPQFAMTRRNFILDEMVGQNLISARDAELAKSLPLDTQPVSALKKKTRYYSFLQFVINRIKQEYDADSLAAGLNIFTTLDPLIQDAAERSVSGSLRSLERKRRLRRNFLQVASVIVNTSTAEIVALIGDRNPDRHGFNRAYQAKRQPGSVLKPVVYMSALEYPSRYTLATQLDDSPLVHKMAGGEVWKPKNYSRRNKGRVSLLDSLVHSYNIPTARVVLDIGVDDFIGRLEDLGARKGLPRYPSISLGAVAMSPVEVAEIYESLANGGYRMPLRVISSVTDTQDNPVSRNPMESLKVISDEPYYLIIKAMQEIVKRGTAKHLKDKIPSSLNVAGKTGTTDNYRDSWFAGFTGNYLNVVWVGNDDNKRTGLSGSNGAMRVWMDIMKGLPLKPLVVEKPANVFEFPIDMSNGRLMGKSCRGRRRTETLPFIAGSEPKKYSYCKPKPKPKPRPVAPSNQYSAPNNYSAPRAQPANAGNWYKNDDDRIAAEARKALEAFGQ